jgi:energy-coupling factor transporter ATP-binding protein EcfA2
MLQVERLSVSREKGERPAPRGLSFEILPGRIVGVAGRNGSGKTSLALVLAGILPRVVGGEWTGHVQFSGLALAAVGWPTSVRAAYSCQDQTSGALLGRLDDVLVSFPDDIRDLSQNLPLPHARTEIQHLSSGQKHIFDWVLCQARRPQILIMDEGLSSLDPVTATSLIQGSRNLKGFGDRVALLIDQDANRLKAHADAIISIPHQSTPTTTDNLSPVRLGAIMWRSHASEDARTERSMTTISARWPNASGQQRFAVPDFCLEAGRSRKEHCPEGPVRGSWTHRRPGNA